MEFQNKTAIITGGASGIGLLSAKCLAKEGANVLLVDINEDTLIEKNAEIACRQSCRSSGNSRFYSVPCIR